MAYACPNEQCKRNHNLFQNTEALKQHLLSKQDCIRCVDKCNVNWSQQDDGELTEYFNWIMAGNSDNVIADFNENKPPEGPCNMCGKDGVMKWHRNAKKKWVPVCQTYDPEEQTCEAGRGNKQKKVMHDTVTVATTINAGFVNIEFEPGERIDNEAVVKKLMQTINITKTNLYSVKVDFCGSTSSSSRPVSPFRRAKDVRLRSRSPYR